MAATTSDLFPLPKSIAKVQVSMGYLITDINPWGGGPFPAMPRAHNDLTGLSPCNGSLMRSPQQRWLRKCKSNATVLQSFDVTLG